VYAYKKYKSGLKDLAVTLLGVMLDLFHSRKKVSFFMAATAVVTLGLIILMIGIIQDFMGDEFQDFNEIAGLLIRLTFSGNWTDTMLFFSFMGSRRMVIPLLILTAIWIFWKGRDKVLELTSLVFVVCGGEIYEESLRRIFHTFSPIKQPLVDELYAFPSERSLMTFVIYGFIVFIFARTVDKVLMRTFVPFIALILVSMIAISRLFLEIELPSHAVAGYVFGGVWIGLNILSLEILRLLRNMDSH
jgi:membrane-associated phospholipid phosphatase